MAPRDRIPPLIAVVSSLANNGYTVRGVRTQRIVGALNGKARTHVLDAGGDPRLSPALWARAWRLARRQFALDHLELKTRRALRAVRWEEYSAAILIGYPYSPLVIAADRLHRAGVPYVVDIGDPWVLTAPRSTLAPIARRRARAAELRLWSRAIGGIVTTDEQADRLRRHVPGLDLLVRPNGVDPVDVDLRPRRKPDRTLRVVHYGGVYGDRLPVAQWLNSLGASGLWDAVEFHQYGEVWRSHLRALLHAHPTVRITLHDQIPWAEVVRGCGEYDVALVVGFHDPSQLPSKAITHQVLPIPKVALVVDATGAALASFAKNRADWLTVNMAEKPGRLSQFLVEAPPTVDCTAPAHDLWPHVAEELADFVVGATISGGDVPGATSQADT